MVEAPGALSKFYHNLATLVYCIQVILLMVEVLQMTQWKLVLKLHTYEYWLFKNGGGAGYIMYHSAGHINIAFNVLIHKL